MEESKPGSIEAHGVALKRECTKIKKQDNEGPAVLICCASQVPPEDAHMAMKSMTQGGLPSTPHRAHSAYEAERCKPPTFCM